MLLSSFYKCSIVFDMFQLDDTDDHFMQPLREYVLYSDSIKVTTVI